MNDTICAISTSLSISAISIIKISGDKSIEIADKLFKGNNLTKVHSHTINYGYIVDDNNNIIDEVLITVMKSPKTFTKENVVEINCHGGIATTNKILELLLLNGCRLAEPGEFTKRAYLNGRIDLIKAESVMDLISAKTELSRKIAINGTVGKASKMIKGLRQLILEVLANIEVNIDYPEYEDAIIYTNKLLNEKLIIIKERLKDILQKSENNKIIKEGIKVGIIGRPNVGKSSILNNLLEEEKAIVTEIEGTTRDIVEGVINLDGIILNIIDTAGIRNTENIVEQKGVEKSLEVIKESELILLVLNNNEKLTEQDKELLQQTSSKKRIIVINKKDLKRKIDIEYLEQYGYIEVSANYDEGLESLKQKIKELYNFGLIEEKDLTYLSSARSISLVKKAIEVVKDIEKSIKADIPIDLIEIDIKKIWDILGEIIGDVYSDQLVEQLFSQFCLGK